MANEARIRINLNQREIEVAGEQEFVERYADQLQAMIERLLELPQVASAASPPSTTDTPTDDSLGSFGEYLHRLPSSATEVDKILAAGNYCERQSTDRCFTTAQANRRLVEQGIKVGNPSQCVKQSLNAKRLIVLTKGVYRVSLEGRSYLRQLIGGD